MGFSSLCHIDHGGVLDERAERASRIIRGLAMKGRISKTLAAVLRDETARRQLREHLMAGKDGELVLHGKRYTVRMHLTRGVKHDKSVTG
jgi:hypothetical protein